MRDIFNQINALSKFLSPVTNSLTAMRVMEGPNYLMLYTTLFVILNATALNTTMQKMFLHDFLYL